MIGELSQLGRFVPQRNPLLRYQEIDFYLSVFKNVTNLAHWIEHCNIILGRRYPLLRSYVETAIGDVTDAVMSIGTVRQDDSIIVDDLKSVVQRFGFPRSKPLPPALFKREISGGKSSSMAQFQNYAYIHCIRNRTREFPCDMTWSVEY